MLQEVVDLIPEVARPLLVAIDGPDAAGKTHFADALAEVLGRQGRAVLRTGIDWFHHPRAHRYARGRTALTVWERSFDFAALRRLLVEPWLAGPGAEFVTRVHDIASDRPVLAPVERVPEGGVLVFDGVFCQRPELINAWDLAIWLDVPPGESARRMGIRDGIPADLDGPAGRYLGAQQIYRDAVDPVGSADVVIDNTDWSAPILQREPSSSWVRQGDRLARWVSVPADRTDLVERLDELIESERVDSAPRERSRPD